jgi:ribosome-binding factor A
MKKISTANYKRSDRVGDLIQVELADIIFRQIKDPRIGVVTITGVKMTDDLKLARIYFVEMGQDTWSRSGEELPEAGARQKTENPPYTGSYLYAR